MRVFSFARLLTQNLCCFRFTTHCIDPARKLAKREMAVIGGSGRRSRVKGGWAILAGLTGVATLRVMWWSADPHGMGPSACQVSWSGLQT
jgi:hypothetical protein